MSKSTKYDFSFTDTPNKDDSKDSDKNEEDAKNDEEKENESENDQQNAKKRECQFHGNSVKSMNLISRNFFIFHYSRELDVLKNSHGPTNWRKN